MAKSKDILIEFGSCETVAYGNLLSAGRYEVDGKVYYSGKLEVMGATLSLTLEAKAVEKLQGYIGKKVQVEGKMLAKNENKELKFSSVDLLLGSKGEVIWESEENALDDELATGAKSPVFK